MGKLRKAFFLGIASCLFAMTAAAGEITLRFSWWGGSERHEATLKAIDLFEKDNPGVKIKAEYMGWQGYLERLTTQYASASEPDIMQMDWAWLAVFSKNGDGFYDLNKAKDSINLAAYEQKWLDSTTINGKLNALPVSFTTQYFYWNKTTFEKAGLTTPKTWDDFHTMGLVFKEKLGDDYYCFDDNRDMTFDMVHTYIFQKTGKQFIDPKKPEVGLSLDEIKEWVGFYRKMVDTHFAVPFPLRAAKGGDVDKPMQEMVDFVEGRWAGSFNWDSAMTITLSTVKKEFEMVLGDYPQLKDAKSSGRIGRPAQIFGVSKNSKNPEMAAKFISFLLTSPEAAEVLKVTRGVMIAGPAYATLEKNNLISPMQRQAMEQIKDVNVHAPSPYFEDPRMIELMRNVFEEVGFGKTTVDQAAERLLNEGNQIVKRLSR